MTGGGGIVGPLAAVLDQVIPDASVRDAAKLELLRLESARALEPIAAQVAGLAEAASTDPWTSRARPTFLYVMYAMLLWSLPMGLVAAVRPQMARDVAAGMAAYLNAIPEPLYALFATGYLGYTVARSWGKVMGVDR